MEQFLNQKWLEVMIQSVAMLILQGKFNFRMWWENEKQTRIAVTALGVAPVYTRSLGSWDHVFDHQMS